MSEQNHTDEQDEAAEPIQVESSTQPQKEATAPHSFSVDGFRIMLIGYGGGYEEVIPDNFGDEDEDEDDYYRRDRFVRRLAFTQDGEIDGVSSIGIDEQAKAYLHDMLDKLIIQANRSMRIVV